jgi:hypothetical protein
MTKRIAGPGDVGAGTVYGRSWPINGDSGCWRWLSKWAACREAIRARIAEALGVHRSMISKDLKRILPLAKICGECGQMKPRLWVEDD